ncbi:hypothetical protein [Polaromonas sp. DSR2-3-2]|uniref:hypothetical protein n=1 Tax=Polaromonas sp. DSR2-3-2 TaxID=2804622 RepID=UPI003CFA750D
MIFQDGHICPAFIICRSFGKPFDGFTLLKIVLPFFARTNAKFFALHTATDETAVSSSKRPILRQDPSKSSQQTSRPYPPEA